MIHLAEEFLKIRGVTAFKVRDDRDPGFPGDSRADLDLQFQIGKQVVAGARRTNPGCKKLDIIDIAQREKNVPPGQPWTEIWTSWACGTLLTSEVRYAPKPGGGISYNVR